MRSGPAVRRAAAVVAFGLLAAAALTACSASGPSSPAASSSRTGPSPPSSAGATSRGATSTEAAPPSSPDVTATVVTVRYRVERRTADEATAGFEDVVHATLGDSRGWKRAGFALVPAADAEFRIILAEGPEVDNLCLPYETFGLYSCQIGPTVALNADRWRMATPQWTGDLASYRMMLVNHEVGHLLGQKHPQVQCPEVGRAAPVMAQQSTELDGCLPNPWPLDHEIERAARYDQPLAPPFER